jgi:hypothetical protein
MYSVSDHDYHSLDRYAASVRGAATHICNVVEGKYYRTAAAIRVEYMQYKSLGINACS